MRRSPARALLARVTSRVLCVTLLAQTFPIPALGERIEWVAAPDTWEQPDVERAEDPGIAPPAPPAEVEELLSDSPPDTETAPPSLPIAPSNDRSVSSTATETPAAPAAVETRSLPPARAPDRTIQPARTPGEIPPLPPGASPAAVLTGASTFVSGWNLSSVQNEPVDKSPAAVFSTIAGQFTRVFAYDACTPGDPWKLYDPANAAASDLTVVDQKIGFWIEMTAPAAVPNPGAVADETTIHLCPGWNLIGVPAEQARPVQTALASIAGRYSRVFGYDPTDAADPWEVFDVAVPAWANDLQVLQPGRGYWILATAETDLTIANTGAEPTVAITAPADLAVVTSPTDITGTVTSDRLQSWTLSYRAHGEAQETVFATGNTPVVNGRLGTFDPTLLLNGGYTVELTATDFNGQSSTVSLDLNVEGQMKIGNFTLSFLDLEIPLSGLPIQVVRNYDSRDKRRGDFGVGWTLELRQGSYRNNRKPGDGWQIAGGALPCLAVQETLSHTTTIRLSDREVYRFRLRLANPAATLGGCFAQARFDFVHGPAPGATLAILGNTEVIYQNATNYVVDSSSFELYEPRQVRLATHDGRVFDLDLQQGVTRLEDLNGNTLSITPTAITHSSGLSVTFQRDGLGRITSITDAEGESFTYSYDAAGDLVTATNRESNTTRFTYTANHLLLDIEDPLGRQPIRNEYDASGRLIRATDSFGKTIEMNHRIGDQQEIVTDRLGHTRLLEYDVRGNIVREVNALGKEVRRSFDARDNLISEIDPLGNTTSYTYTTANKVEAIQDPEGNVTRRTYDARGNVLTTTDPRGKVTTNTYDSRGNLLTTKDPLGNETTYTYDSRGNRTSETNAEGDVTPFTHDSQGNITKEIDAAGTETTLTYDRNGKRRTQTTTRTTATGTETLRWTYEYDRAGRLTAATDPDGTTSRAEYNALGNIKAMVGKLGRRTSFTYDSQGQLTRTDYPDETFELRSYDAEGRLLSTTDRGGKTTTYAYDVAGRLTTTTHHDGSSVESVYDEAGRLVESRDARGNRTRYGYDRGGRRTSIVDALGQTMLFTYDATGNQTSVRDARGNTTSFEYDDAGRLVRTVYPDGTDREVTYDGLARRVAETDPAGLTTSFGYDALDRLKTVTDALGQVTRYAYDEQGNRISQIDANGHETRFEYDALGRQTRRVLPDGASETFAYDAAGNLDHKTTFGGLTIQYAYDTMDRLLSRTSPSGNAGFTYTATGQRKTAVDARGTTLYEYDSRDRLVRLVYPDGRELRYAWDAAGNRTELTVAVGGTTATTTFIYDALNRLETVADPTGRVYTHAYNPNGSRASLEYPNGIKTEYTYDRLNRLTELATTRVRDGAVVQRYAYTLGPAGNRTAVEEHDGTVRAYGYDSLYRLTAETVSGAAGEIYRKVFGYDPVGNRLTQQHSNTGAPATPKIYTYDTRDRLLTENSTSYTWDIGGRLTAKGAEANYTWDPEDRLTQVTLADGTVVRHTYNVDGVHVRTAITAPGGTTTATEYLVDTSGPLSQVVAEGPTTATVAVLYVRGDDLLALVRGTATRFYHADGLGSIRALTDETGEITDRYDFTAFGELLSHEGEYPNAYLFAGEALDPNSGWYYNRARWMDPGVGRFTSVDPYQGRLVDPVSLHRYLYAAAQPTNAVDPSGELVQPLIFVKEDLELRAQELQTKITAIQIARVAAASMWLIFALVAAMAKLAEEDEEPKQKGRGRIQLQGDDLKKRFGHSTPPLLQWPWAPPRIPPSKAEGLAALRGLWNLLNEDEQRRRATALRQATRFINQGPHWGFMTRSFHGSRGETEQHKYPNTPRIDIEIIEGVAFW